MFSKENIDKYTNGNCNIFAIALNHLNNNLKVQTKIALDEEWNEIICHSWCIDNKGTIIDIKGSSISQFFDKEDMEDFNENEIIQECNDLLLQNYYDDNESYILEGTDECIQWTQNIYGDISQSIEEAKITILNNKQFCYDYNIINIDN